MKFLSVFLSVILLGFMCEAVEDDSNPCNGEVFSLVCQILRVMKKDIDNSKKQLQERFNVIREMRLNDTCETKMAIEREANNLSTKHASDIKMVTKTMEEKVKVLSYLLKHKINETKKDLNIKIENIMRSSKNDVSQLKVEMLKRIKNNTSAYNKGARKLETEIEVNKNTLTQQLQNEVVTIKKDVNSKYSTLKSECNNNLAAVKNELIQQIQRNNQQLQDLKKTYDQVKIAKWPTGRYCILANGPCPTGFKRVDGFMRAISLYAGNGNYIRQATFGSSNIRCHGRCGQYGHWIGELNLTTCCK